MDKQEMKIDAIKRQRAFTYTSFSSGIRGYPGQMGLQWRA